MFWSAQVGQVGFDAADKSCFWSGLAVPLKEFDRPAAAAFVGLAKICMFWPCHHSAYWFGLVGSTDAAN